MIEKKLTLEMIAPYLPYGLKVHNKEIDLTMTMDAVGYYSDTLSIEDVISYGYKPILRPLSWLTKEIEHNGEMFVPYRKLGWKNGDMFISCVKSKTKKDLPYRDAVKLFEWKFDVFGLLDAGLAIEEGGQS